MFRLVYNQLCYRYPDVALVVFGYLVKNTQLSLKTYCKPSKFHDTICCGQKWTRSGVKVENQLNPVVPPNEPPRGMYPCRLDDKGRLKLPAAFQQYFGSLPEKKVFVTSLDRRTAQIYPIAVWRENEKFFDSYRENPQMAQDVYFTANDLGADAEPDAQGRVLINPELRRELDMESQALHMQYYKGRAQVFTEAVYQERRQRAAKSATENLEALERAGLK